MSTCDLPSCGPSVPAFAILTSARRALRASRRKTSRRTPDGRQPGKPCGSHVIVEDDFEDIFAIATRSTWQAHSRPFAAPRRLRHSAYCVSAITAARITEPMPAADVRRHFGPSLPVWETCLEAGPPADRHRLHRPDDAVRHERHLRPHPRFPRPLADGAEADAVSGAGGQAEVRSYHRPANSDGIKPHCKLCIFHRNFQNPDPRSCYQVLGPIS